MSFKKAVRQFIPGNLLSAYHFFLAYLSHAVYGFPARRMVVIGITGTKGKTSASYFAWSVLTHTGHTTGLISTAEFRIGKETIANPYHMTMPGRFFLARTMRRMVRAGCTYLVLETTSEGIAQWRHRPINYDIAVFTNLSPEHIESHGSYEAYKNAKGKLFSSLMRHRRKKLNGALFQKVSIVNSDDKEANFFLRFPADKKITYNTRGNANVVAYDISSDKESVSFKVDNVSFVIHIPGDFNVKNALPAIIIARELHIQDAEIVKGVAALRVIPGRMEEIREGQRFRVFVDYAHEQQSMTVLLKAARCLVSGRIIVLLGSEGGGRDHKKRSDLGSVAASLADIVVFSTTDPYDDDPKQILAEMAETASRNGKREGENMFVVVDRRLGIQKAFQLARDYDIVLITGMGAQQTMIMKGEKSFPWNERAIVKEALEQYVNKKTASV